MKISYKGDYALKVILDLSQNYSKELVHIEDLAKRQDIPPKFLEQILLTLKKGGFIQSKKGPKGGYSLNRSPQDITLGEVVRFIEGSVYPISCIDPDENPTCDQVATCVFGPIWKKVGQAISEIIDKVTFQDLKDKAIKQQEKQVLNYFI